MRWFRGVLVSCAVAALGLGAEGCSVDRDPSGGAAKGGASATSGGTAGKVGSGGTAPKGGNGGSGGSGGSAGSAAGGVAGSSAGSSGQTQMGGSGAGGMTVTGCGGVDCASEASCVELPTPHCECPAGYTDPRGDGSLCADVDECADANGGCDPLVACTNTPGGFSCGGCPSGYTADGKGGCVDIDECATKNGDCDPLVACTNTAGGHVCGNCPHGYSGAGDTGCRDINECATNNGGCDAAVVCTNTPGSYMCGNCPAGHTGGGSSGCVDIDECATKNGGCDPLSVCTNTKGSFSCGACPSGYSGTGASGCVDVDECATNNGGCSANGTCTNKAGGRDCACKSGFSGNGVTCTDVNECMTNNGGCNANATCTNTTGSRTCACKSGFSGNGVTCTDVDECMTNNGGCSTNATCTNTTGSRTCACKANYTGDGVTCACATAPAVPALLAPYRGAYTGSMRAPAARMARRPKFVFKAVTSACGAVTYELQADNSCSPGSLDTCAFSSPEISVTGLTATTYTPAQDMPVSTSAPVGAYYAWRVRACDATQVCSAWSAPSYLHVGRVREDLNGDGYGDMIVLDNTSTLQVYLGAAAPDFTRVSSTPAVPTSSDRIGAFIGDIDSDGFGDVGLMQYYTPTNGYAPAVMFGGTNLTARAPLVLIKSSAGSSLNLNLHPAGDFNGDGFHDFLVDFKYFDPKTELQVFYGAAQPANQAALHIPCNFLGYTLTSNEIGDINRDGFPDIAMNEAGTVGSAWVGRVAIFAGAKTPSLTPVADLTRTNGPTTLLFPGNDLDGDGFGDALIAENSVGVTLYKGAATFPQATWKTLANVDTTAGLGGFDINGDGYGDVFLKGTTASIYVGGSSGPATATPFPTARGANAFSAVGRSDHDGDGLPDLIGSTPDTPMWCASSGTATPTCVNVTKNGASYTSGAYAFVR
ncbi:MAG: EGF domain-containing protein [Myxococcota bacterium]